MPVDTTLNIWEILNSSIGYAIAILVFFILWKKEQQSSSKDIKEALRDLHKSIAEVNKTVAKLNQTIDDFRKTNSEEHNKLMNYMDQRIRESQENTQKIHDEILQIRAEAQVHDAKFEERSKRS